jgi:hypothetical protein
MANAGITSVTFLISLYRGFCKSLSMSSFRPFSMLAAIGFAITLSTGSLGQVAPTLQSSFTPASGGGIHDLAIASTTPRLSPDLALATYERGMKAQSEELTGYSSVNVIEAELPASAQRAEFELKRHYVAPSVLEFTPVRSSGDKFVKSNVIVRLLQSEVDHVHKREQSQTAIDSSNYKFNYKGTSQLNGNAAHVYEVKPRENRVGLFKGKIYVDAATGHLLRAQGRIAKSPSFFIKKINFVQDYGTISGFTFPTHLHSEAETRLVGKAIVDITHRDYQLEFPGGSDVAESVTLIDGTN